MADYLRNKEGKAVCALSGRPCMITHGNIPEEWEGCECNCDLPIEAECERRAEMATGGGYYNE